MAASCQGFVETLGANDLLRSIDRMKKPGFSLTPMVDDGCDPQLLCTDANTDAECLAQAGITHEQLADLLHRLMLQCQHNVAVGKDGALSGGSAVQQMLSRMLGSEPEPEPLWQMPNTKFLCGKSWCMQSRCEAPVMLHGCEFLVHIVSWGGAQECPFKHPEDKKYHGCEYGCRDVIIRNMANGTQLQFSDLLPHMIKKHHWFEGPNSRYRVDPTEAINVLGEALVPYRKKPEVSARLLQIETKRWSMASMSSQALGKTFNAGQDDVFELPGGWLVQFDPDDPDRIKMRCTLGKDATNDAPDQFEYQGATIALSSLNTGSFYELKRTVRMEYVFE